MNARIMDSVVAVGTWYDGSHWLMNPFGFSRVEVADLSRNVLNHATFFSSVNGNVLKNVA